jgi:phosphoglycolate phosphatase
MKRYKLIIFDFDGTLVDTAPDIRYHANAVLRDFGYPERSLSDVTRSIGRGVHELLKELAPAFDESPEILEKAVGSFKKRYWDAPVIHTAPYSGVREVLVKHYGSAIFAIATNKPDDITRAILEKLDLSRYFKAVIGMHAGFPPKPDPASVLEIMSRSNILASDTILIGDSGIDSQTGRNALIDFGWAPWGYDSMDGSTPSIRFERPYDWNALFLNK